MSTNTAFAVSDSYLDSLDSEAEALTESRQKLTPDLDQQAFVEELSNALPESYELYTQLDESRRERIYHKYLSDNHIEEIKRYIDKQMEFHKIHLQRAKSQ
ncbi:MAG: hypothetical protein OEZ16_05290 [Chromatiales bacterium]|nr:hypothetical protein [Chromatiales bacterium]